MSELPPSKDLLSKLRAYHPTSGYARVMRQAADEIERLEQQKANLLSALESKQARIDALMLEFCPGEMSAEQRAEYAKAQQPALEPPPASKEKRPDSELLAHLRVIGENEAADAIESYRRNSGGHFRQALENGAKANELQREVARLQLRIRTLECERDAWKGSSDAYKAETASALEPPADDAEVNRCLYVAGLKQDDASHAAHVTACKVLAAEVRRLRSTPPPAVHGPCPACNTRWESSAPPPLVARKFTGIGHLEETGYIPAGSAEERERAAQPPTADLLDALRGLLEIEDARIATGAFKPNADAQRRIDAARAALTKGDGQ